MIPTQAAVDRELISRRGLIEFVRRAWHIVEPGAPFQENWHHRLMCDVAMHCVAGVTPEVLCNQPPGTTKSRLFCVFLPAWIWTEWPAFCSLYASADIGISIRDAQACLQILQSDWYRRRWPEVQLVGSNPAATHFSNAAGGFRLSTSVGSKAVGYHAHLRVFDDPIKPLDVMGGRETTGKALQKCVDWWDGTMSTRVRDPKCARYLGIMQRLHDLDLSGYLAKKDHPLRIVLPMHFDPTRAFDQPGIGKDPRTQQGELLWPGRFDEETVQKLAKKLGVHAPAQLEQDPVLPTGGTFKEKWLRYYEKIPQVSRKIMSVDCTFKKTAESDNVAVQVWGATAAKYSLLDEIAEQMTFTETVQVVRQVKKKWPDIGAILIEDKANGPAVIDTLKKEIPGIIPVEPEGGKESRANAVAYLHEAGCVEYPSPTLAPWVVEHVAEILRFPRGAHDDRVDAETQALKYLVGNGISMWDALDTLRKQR